MALLSLRLLRHKDGIEMLIELATLGRGPKSIKGEFGSDELEFADEPLELKGPARFDGRVEGLGTRARMRGVVTADLLLNCTRCLEPVPFAIDTTFESVFVEPGDLPQEAETELGDEQLDESPVENGVIDLADVVREQILLSVPTQVLCQEDCKGLCETCGTNRNQGHCDCSSGQIDPRWAALKNLQ
jgi:uncharacterized protein